MLRRLTLALALTALIAGCATTTVHVDYDRDAVLNSYETFSWMPTEETSLKPYSPMLHDRMVAAVENKLEEGGIRRVKEVEPDLYVTYHYSSRDEYKFNTASFGYSYGPSYTNSYWGPTGGATQVSAQVYQKGTLVIDIWDAKTTNLIWRGIAEKVASDDLRKSEEAIFKAVDKMVAEFKRLRTENP